MRIFKLSTIVLAAAVLMGCASAVRPLGKIGIEDIPKATETIQKEIDRLPAPDCAKIAVAV